MSHKTLRIALLIGSVRANRLAAPIAGWLRRELDTLDWVDVDVIDLADVSLPSVDLSPGNDASPIADRLDRADGFLILTPEYNHSFPSALKNAIDWHYTQWARKPVAFVSYGASSGGVRAVEQLRLIFPELRAMTTRNAVALSQPWGHLEDGHFTPPDPAYGALGATLDELRWWAEALRAARLRDAVAA